MLAYTYVRRGGKLSPRLFSALLMATLMWFMFSGVASAQSIVPAPNPDLAPACGLNVALVLDASNSIDDIPDAGTSPEQQVRDAAESFVTAFEDTGSNLAIIEFGSTADTPIPYTLVNQTTISDTIEPYIHSIGAGDGYHDGRLGECTNWDDAFRQVNELPSKPDLVVFMTDGQPNTVNGGTACGTTVPDALDAAATQANITKSGSDGSHIFVVGISDIVVKSNLRSITEDPNQIYNTANLATADFTLGTFSSLYSDLQDIAFGLCAPSVTINKTVDNLDGNGIVPHSSQTFIGEVSVDSGTYIWTSPGTPSGNNRQGTTDANGKLTFQWDRSDVVASSTIKITENVQPGYSFVGAACTVKTINAPTAQALPIQLGPANFTAQVNTGDLVTCNVRNARHRITVEKSAMPASLPEPSGPVTYTYTVNNLGGTSVTLSTLIDSQFGDLNGQGTCTTHSTTAPVNISSGQSYTCSIVKTISGNAGQVHTNSVTATVANSAGAQASDTAAATVTVTDVQPTAIVSKSAFPENQPEASAPFTFTVTISNTGAAESLTILSLMDTQFGDVSTVANKILSTDCTVPQILAPSGQVGAAYTCQFVASVEGNPGDYADTISATLTDDETNQITVSDGTVVSLTDVPPTAAINITPNPVNKPEPGGLFAFTITISNTNPVESLTIDSLSDSLYGDVTTIGGPIISSTCQISQTMAAAGQPGDAYSCFFSVEHAGNPATFDNTITAQVSDDDGNSLPISADSQVAIIDLPSGLEVTRTADRFTVPEPGGDVTFTVNISNTSLVDTVTITKVVDMPTGAASALDISASCAGTFPITLAPGAGVVCQYSQFVSGNASDVYASAIVVTAFDDDGLSLERTADESIDVIDLPSAIRVTKLANVSEVMDPGANVEYMVTVQNISVGDTVTISSLIDDRFGDISVGCNSALPADLAPGATLTCPFTGYVGGPVGTTHISIVTAAGVDDDGNSLTDSDQEEIEIDDVPSSIKVIETASPSGVSEPGADVTFTAIVRNTSVGDSVMITQVVSIIDGAVTDISANCFLAPPVVLAPGEEISCEFTDFVGGTGGNTLTNQVQAFGQDDDGNPVADFDLESVDVFNVASSIRVTKQASKASIPEPGGPISFAITIKNTSLVDTVTVEQIEHSVPVIQQRMGGAGVGNTCAALLPSVLVPGATITCLSTELVTGAVGNTALATTTVTATDDDGNTLVDSAQGVVDITNVPSAVRVDLTAGQVGLSEPGGSVIFTAQIQNTSQLDSVTIQSVNSAQSGDVGATCLPALTTSLAPGEQLTCTYTLTFFGNQGDSFTDTITTIGLDDDGITVNDDDTEQVDIVDLLPTIAVRKMISPTTIPETGADVTFTFEVINNSQTESVNLENMQDASLGDLNGQGNCTTPQSIAADGGSYTCTVTLFIQGDFGNNDSAQVRATAFDDDGSEDTGSDIQELFFTDVLPDIGITAAISPSQILETGQNVSHALIITNNSAEEVVINSLVDSAGDSLHGLGSCSLPQTIPGNGTYACSFTRFVAGAFGTPQTNIIVATGIDDELNNARAADSDTIIFSEVAPQLIVNKTDALLIDTFNDPSQQGQVSPGDTLAYTITVTNQGNAVASSVQLLDVPDGATPIIVGSVQTSKGTVATGNGQGDTQVIVDIGLLAINETAAVTFNVLVDPDTDVLLIGNQAQVTYGVDGAPGGVNAVISNDPTTPDGQDETKTTVTFAPQSLDTIKEPLNPEGPLDYIFLPMILK